MLGRESTAHVSQLAHTRTSGSSELCAHAHVTTEQYVPKATLVGVEDTQVILVHFRTLQEISFSCNSFNFVVVH